MVWEDGGREPPSYPIFPGCLANERPMIPSLFLFFFSATSTMAPLQALEGTAASPTVEGMARESAQREMAIGRSWRAAGILKEAFPQGPGSDGELTLLFARAEAGWKNWEGVVSVLEGSPVLGDGSVPEGGSALGEGGEEEAWFLY